MACAANKAPLTRSSAFSTPCPRRRAHQQLDGPDADRLRWGHLVERSAAVQDLLTAAAVPAFPELLTDLFNPVFKLVVPAPRGGRRRSGRRRQPGASGCPGG